MNKLLERCKKAYEANNIPWTKEVEHLLKKLPALSANLIAASWELRARDSYVDESALADQFTLREAKALVARVAAKLSCKGGSQGAERRRKALRQFHGDNYFDC